MSIRTDFPLSKSAVLSPEFLVAIREQYLLMRHLLQVRSRRLCDLSASECVPWLANMQALRFPACRAPQLG